MDTAAELRKLSRNLFWTWEPEIIDVFRDIDPVLWREVNHNPIAFLTRFSPERLEEKASELALEARINHAFHLLREYLEQSQTWGAYHAGALRARPVAYFSAEFGIHESLPLYSGGLGVLAGDHLKSASDLGIPIVGVGLFYARGYFRQALGETGWQQEKYPEADVSNLPLDREKDKDGKPLQVAVETGDSRIHIAIWSARVGRNRLLLLDTDVQDNNRDDRDLTVTLYGGNTDTRIRQELVLGVGGLRALKTLGIQPGVLHLNEGHSAFAALELARSMMEREKRSFRDVRERASAASVFTTHTPVEAGHDRFPPELVERTVRPLRRKLGLSPNEFLALGRSNPQDDGEPLCMTTLGMRMSHRVNAVSAQHGRVARAMWNHLWPAKPQKRVPIEHITNGVHVRSWISVPMAQLYTQYLGQNWEKHLCYPETWADVDRIDDEELWDLHRSQKAHLMHYIHRCACRQCCQQKHASRLLDHADIRLEPENLTIGFARRFTTYKRAELLLEDLDRLNAIINDEDNPVQIIYAGKAHPADDPGKRVIQKVIQTSEDPRFKGRILFLEDYDINVCRHLVQGVDVWLNTPRRPLEACGTSGQKVVLNGGLNLSILAGWWASAYDGQNGFAIGEGTEHSVPDEQDRLDSKRLYESLEATVVPLFYKRDKNGLPRDWIERQ
ncbi:MAG: alpha-glucan family phosphorylase, partial [Planctomycetes bacterium]|nr:alpha-glucan family phosphorylase [Planctomycetota bacterium]